MKDDVWYRIRAQTYFLLNNLDIFWVIEMLNGRGRKKKKRLHFGEITESSVESELGGAETIWAFGWILQLQS